MSLTYLILEKPSTEDNFFSEFYITVHVNAQPAGFSRIHYISQETFCKKLLTPLSFFIYKINQGNHLLIKAYEDNNFQQLITLLPHFGKNWDEIKENIHNSYSKNHSKFINYWVEKPTTKLIYVLTEKDTKFSFIENNLEICKSISSHNFRGQQISKSLMMFASHILKEKQLSLWESSTQTIEGGFLWKKALPNCNLASEISTHRQYQYAY